MYQNFFHGPFKKNDGSLEASPPKPKHVTTEWFLISLLSWGLKLRRKKLKNRIMVPLCHHGIRTVICDARHKLAQRKVLPSLTALFSACVLCFSKISVVWIGEPIVAITQKPKQFNVSHRVLKNARLWQRFCDTFRGLYSSKPWLSFFIWNLCMSRASEYQNGQAIPEALRSYGFCFVFRFNYIH